MFSLVTFLIRAVFNLVKSKKHLLLQACLYKKEIEILKRQNQKKRLNIQYSDRLIFSILNRIGNIKDILTIVKPETVLLWQKLMIKRFWTYKSKNRTGRPPVKKEIKQIILNMNAIAERFVGSVRQEVLDFYILINEKQIQRILDEYISYYNSRRPHQGLDQRIPMKYKPRLYGKVQKLPILGGLHHHYIRSAA